MSDQQQPVEVPRCTCEACPQPWKDPLCVIHVAPLDRAFYIFAEAFFARWEDGPPEETAKRWEEDLRPAFEKAAPILTASRDKHIEELEGELEAARAATGRQQHRADVECDRGNLLEEEKDRAEDALIANRRVVAAARHLVGASAGHPSRPSARRASWDALERALATLDTSEQGEVSGA